MARYGVLFGGPSPEHDISVLTGLQACRALSGRAEVVAIYWSKTADFWSVAPDLEAAAYLNGVPAKSTRLELTAQPGGGFISEGGRFAKRAPLQLEAIVNACHGGPGENGTLQAALDLAGVRYTGPSAAGAALGMDKLAFASVVRAGGLPSLPRHALTSEGGPPPFEGPYIVKPRFGGSSIGIEITDDLQTVRALVQSSPLYREGAIVEPYLASAADLNVSVRTAPSIEVSAIERPVRADKNGRIYTYADKYLGGGDGLDSAPRELPANVPKHIETAVTDAARAIVDLALVRSLARIDFLWAGDDVWVNEINTIPGSLGRYFWTQAGVPFDRLLLELLAEAASGPGVHWSSTGADGSALRAAGSIAGKLA